MGNSISHPEDNFAEVQKIKHILDADTEMFVRGGALGPDALGPDPDAIRAQQQMIEQNRIRDAENRRRAENRQRDRPHGVLILKAINEGNLENLQQIINNNPGYVFYPIIENDLTYEPIDLAIDRGNLPMIKFLRQVMKHFQNA